MSTDIQAWQKKVYHLQENDFEETALALFRWQAVHNSVYKSFLKHLNKSPDAVQALTDIPFLPISLFKNHQIKTGNWVAQTHFESSGTTGSVSSKHFIHHTAFYDKLAVRGFEALYGPLDNFIILALLPSYLERQHASLVHMVAHFIKQTSHPLSGFFLEDDKIEKALYLARQQKDKKILIWGVSFALLDWAEKIAARDNFEPLPTHAIVMETGGMKGRRKEITREELHKQLTSSLGTRVIHNEYGMTEMLSQAYDNGTGIFKTPAQLRILLRDINDPLSMSTGSRGGINVIDLANVHSCAFIATQDIGQWEDEQKTGFSVLGRFDHSDLRGCNLMVG